jgi:Flp pilus assembly protein TadG
MQDRSIRTEGGQSLVEFAVILVLLMILLTVIVDGARALFTYLSLRDAAQESASYASYQPADTEGIIQRACQASNIMNDLCSDADRCPSVSKITGTLNITTTLTGSGACMATSSGGQANGIRVDIQYPCFHLSMPLVGAFIGSQTVPIGVQVIDTILSPTCP